ncbi:MAG TPA: hypothetical protein VHB98_09380, partial [Chloroflexota bacterium]|nr:hypothetical protein [Chloroflexota bacterium]
MAGYALTAEALDALRKLAYLDGDRAVVVVHLAQARERAARDTLLEAERARLRQAEEEAKRAVSTRRAHEATIQDLQAQVKR